jgi:hypothetical protein
MHPPIIAATVFPGREPQNTQKTAFEHLRACISGRFWRSQTICTAPSPPFFGAFFADSIAGPKNASLHTLSTGSSKPAKQASFDAGGMQPNHEKREPN